MPNLKSLKNFKSQIFKLQMSNQISNLFFSINRKRTWNVYCGKTVCSFSALKKAVKSSNHFKCLSNGQHWIASNEAGLLTKPATHNRCAKCCNQCVSNSSSDRNPTAL